MVPSAQANLPKNRFPNAAIEQIHAPRTSIITDFNDQYLQLLKYTKVGTQDLSSYSFVLVGGIFLSYHSD